MLSFEGGRVLPYYSFIEEEEKKTRFNGFFLYIEKAPLSRGALLFIKANCRNSEEQAAGEQKCSKAYNPNLLHLPLPNF